MQYQLPNGVNPPIIVACRLATPENCGSLIRLADSVGSNHVFITRWGEKLSEQKIRRTAGKSFERVQLHFIEEENLFSALPSGFEWIGLETAVDSLNIHRTELPKNMILVVGSEKLGIPDSILTRCSRIVHIPLTGSCTSLNVTHATAIALFEWVRQIL